MTKHPRISPHVKACLALMAEWLAAMVAGMFALLISSEPGVAFVAAMFGALGIAGWFAWWRHRFLVAIGRSQRPELALDTPERVRAARNALNAAANDSLHANLDLRRRASELVDALIANQLTLDAVTLERDRHAARAAQLDDVAVIIRRKPPVPRPRFAGEPLRPRRPLWAGEQPAPEADPFAPRALPAAQDLDVAAVKLGLDALADELGVPAEAAHAADAAPPLKAAE